jgi:hypothetical protein
MTGRVGVRSPVEIARIAAESFREVEKAIPTDGAAVATVTAEPPSLGDLSRTLLTSVQFWRDAIESGEVPTEDDFNAFDADLAKAMNVCSTAGDDDSAKEFGFVREALAGHRQLFKLMYDHGGAPGPVQLNDLGELLDAIADGLSAAAAPPAEVTKAAEEPCCLACRYLEKTAAETGRTVEQVRKQMRDAGYPLEDCD